MAIERQNPLPIGRYWVDVPAAKRDEFYLWLQRWKGSVVVETTESGDEIDWILFRTESPYVEWEGPGLPTIADDDVRDKGDVIQRPDPPPPLEERLEQAATSGIKAGFVTLGIGGALLLLLKRGK